MLDESAERVDLLFTDYYMPGMNGIELIERVAVKWPEMKLVLASGYLDEEARARLEVLKVSVLVIVRRPPLGIASCAFTHKLSNA